MAIQREDRHRLHRMGLIALLLVLGNQADCAVADTQPPPSAANTHQSGGGALKHRDSSSKLKHKAVETPLLDGDAQVQSASAVPAAPILPQEQESTAPAVQLNGVRG